MTRKIIANGMMVNSSLILVEKGFLTLTQNLEAIKENTANFGYLK